MADELQKDGTLLKERASKVVAEMRKHDRFWLKRKHRRHCGNKDTRRHWLPFPITSCFSETARVQGDEYTAGSSLATSRGNAVTGRQKYDVRDETALRRPRPDILKNLKFGEEFYSKTNLLFNSIRIEGF